MKFLIIILYLTGLIISGIMGDTVNTSNIYIELVRYALYASSFVILSDIITYQTKPGPGVKLTNFSVFLATFAMFLIIVFIGYVTRWVGLPDELIKACFITAWLTIPCYFINIGLIKFKN